MLRELHRATVSHSCLRGVSTGWWRTYIYLLKATPKVPGHTSAECFLVFLQHRRTNSPSPLSQSVPIRIHFSLATQNNVVLSCVRQARVGWRRQAQKCWPELLQWKDCDWVWDREGGRGGGQRGSYKQEQHRGARTVKREIMCKYLLWKRSLEDGMNLLVG